MCQEKAPLEATHIQARASHGEGATQKICQSCHRGKSEDEHQAGVSLFAEMMCPFSSFFAADILESLVKKRSPLSVIRNLTKVRPRQGPIFEFDVNRCRARILRGRDGWDWPVFSVLETIRPLGGPICLRNCPGHFLVRRSLQTTLDGETYDVPEIQHPELLG